MKQSQKPYQEMIALTTLKTQIFCTSKTTVYKIRRKMKNWRKVFVHDEQKNIIINTQTNKKEIDPF